MKRHGDSICLAVVCLWMLLVPSSGHTSAQSGSTFRLYPGPERPAVQVAILLASRGNSIVAVNGGEIGQESQIALLPGRHTVTLKGIERSTGIVRRFDAEAGHSYEVRMYRFERIIVDLATMEPVGEVLPAPTRDGSSNDRVRDKDGNWRYIVLRMWMLGRTSSGECSTNLISLADFGKDLAERFRWGLNAMGYVLMDVSEKPFPSQHVRMRCAGSGNQDLFVGDGTPVIRSGKELYVGSRLAGANLVELINLSPSQMNTISGLAQKIARGCHEKDVIKVEKSTFCFTHADGGDFFAILTVRDFYRKQQILTFSEKE